MEQKQTKKMHGRIKQNQSCSFNFILNSIIIIIINNNNNIVESRTRTKCAFYIFIGGGIVAFNYRHLLLLYL